MESSPLCVLTVHAHPDDEASKGAPTLAKYHAEGVRTVLVCCTGGEEGDLQNPGLREPGQPFHDLSAEQEKALLAELRPLELARSAAIIGFDEVVMLGYRDSGMADSEANHHPDCFHMAPLDDAVGRLVAIIRREKPQVIITYGDDQRGYLHPDHLKVHDISGPAFDRAGDPAWYPELGEPWQPQKLYYTMWSKARMVAVHEGLLRHHGPRPSHPHSHRGRAVSVGAQRFVAGACHSGRPHRAVVVRPQRRAVGRGLPMGRLDPRPFAGRRAPAG